MKIRNILLALFVFAQTVAAAPVRDRYIVVLDASADAPRARAAAQGHGAQLGSTFKRALNGFSINATADVAQRIGRTPGVRYVEKVTEVVPSATQANPANWGLDRIDQRDHPLDHAYNYNTSGAGVNVFVIDTGINFAHTEFSNQTPRGVDIQDILWNPNDHRFDPDPETYSQDCWRSGSTTVGHGTHVASIAAGQQHGVAKNATLWSIKVANCTWNTIMTEAVIGGFEWVLGNNLKPGVVNLSINNVNGNESQALRDAIQAVLNAGIPVVWSAGNYENITGAGQGTAIVVGAATVSDRRVTGTAWGASVYAPGLDITTASATNTVGTFQFNNTSAAAPFVTGSVARYLQSNPNATAGQAYNSIVNNATYNKVGNIPYGFEKRLLYIAP